MSGSLPLVGVSAVIAGIDAFKANAAQVKSTLLDLNNVSKTAASGVSDAWSYAATAFESSAGLVVKAALAVEAALGVTEVIAGKAAANYEATITSVGAVSEATATQMQQLNSEAAQIGSTTTVSMGEAAKAADELVRSGLNMDQVLGGALKATTDLSIASGGREGLAQSAQLVAQGMQAWADQGATAVQVTNAILTLATKTSIGFSGVQQAFNQTSTVAAQLGLSVYDASAAIGVLAESGTKGGIGGITAVRTMLDSLIKPSTEATVQMKKFGISFTDASGNIRPFRDLLVDLNAKFGSAAVASGKISEAQRDFALSTIFGSQSLRAALALVDDGVTKFDALTGAMQGTVAADLAGKMLTPLNAQLGILKNQLGEVAIALGAGFLPLIERGVQSQRAFFSSINPAALALFAQAVQLLTGTGGGSKGELFAGISSIASPEQAVQLQTIFTLLQNIGAAITQQILPAAGAFKDAFVSLVTNNGSLTDFVTTFNNISQGIRTAAAYIADLLGGLTTLLNDIGQNASAAQLFKDILAGIVSVPIIGIILGLGSALLGTLVPILATGAAIGAIGFAIVNIDWSGFISIVQQVGSIVYNNLNVILLSAAAAVGILAAAVAVSFVVSIAPAVGAIGALVVALGAATVSAGLMAAGVIFAAVSALGEVLISAIAASVGALAAFTVSLIASATAASGLTLALLTGLIAALPGLVVAIGVSTIALGANTAEFVLLGAAAALTTAILIGNFVAQGLATMIASIPRVLASMGALIVSFGATAVAAATSAATSAAAWVVSAVPAIIGAFGAIIAAIGPFLVGIAAIAAIVVLIATAWQNDWLNIQETARAVIANVSALLSGFADALKGLPGPMGEFFTNVGDGFDALGSHVNDFVVNTVPEIQDFADQLGAVIKSLPDTVPDALKAMDDLNKKVADAQQAAKDAADAANAQKAALGDLANTAGALTVPAIIDFAGAEKQATKEANALKEAIKTAEDAARSFAREANKAFEEFNTKATEIAERTATQINEATQNTAEEITKIWNDEGKKVDEDAYRNATDQANRKRKLDLDNELQDEKTARQNAIDDSNTLYQRDVDNARLALQQKLQDADSAFKRQQESAAAMYQQQEQTAEASYRAQAQSAETLFNQGQEANLSAMQRGFEETNRLRDEANQRADQQAKTQVDLSHATTAAERASIQQRAQDQQLADTRSFSNAGQDARIKASQSVALEKQRQLDQVATQQLSQRNSEVELGQRQSAAIAERTFKQQQDIAYTAFKRGQDAILLAATRADEDAATARKRKQQQDDVEFEHGQKQRQQDLDDQISDEALAHDKQRAQDDAQARVDTLNAALDDKVLKLTADAQKETDQLRANLAQHLEDLKQQYLDKIPDLLNNAGDEILPVLQYISTQMDTMLRNLEAQALATASALNLVYTGNSEPIVIEPPSFARGGVVPGSYGAPQLVIAHGGERFAGLGFGSGAEGGMREVVPMLRQAVVALTSVAAAEASAPNSGTGSTQNSYHYEVNANYAQQQSAASVAMDLRALIALSR